MTQPNPYPSYPLEYQTNPAPKRKIGLGIFAWLFFILAVALIMVLLQHTAVSRQAIPLSDFRTQLLSNNIYEASISGDEITGKLKTPAGGTVAFATELPAGTSGNWGFTQWLLENGQGAKITVNNQSNLIVNILLPLIPWLLIFFFIWFFVFRTLRRRTQLQQSAPPPMMPPAVPGSAPFAAWVYPYQPAGQAPAPATELGPR